MIVRRERNGRSPMTAPQPNGHPLLSGETVAALIQATSRDVNVSDVRHLGSGWDFDAFLTQDGWVYRFPRKPECADQLDFEQELLALVSGALPVGVAVPRTEIVGQPSSAFPLRFARYRYLRGVAADTPGVRLANVAQTIGVSLAAVHAVPEREARAVGVAEMDVDDVGRSQWFHDGLESALGLRGQDPVVDRAIDWAVNAASAIPTYDGPVRLIHHDLSPDHLLVDPDSGRLVGIIDWTDAILGDPARDFVALVAWQGWSFADEALASYGLALDSEFRARVDFIAKLLSVIWLANTHDLREDVAKHVRWVHNSFADRS